MREENYKISGAGRQRGEKQRETSAYPIGDRARRRFARDFRRVVDGLKDHGLRETDAAAAVENYYYGDVEVGEFREPIEINLSNVVKKGLYSGSLVIVFYAGYQGRNEREYYVYEYRNQSRKGDSRDSKRGAGFVFKEKV